MDYNLLKVLKAVVETGNITHAAKLLHLSQPATSNALARLRSTMDDPILIRVGNKMIPTSRALQGARQAELTIAEIEKIFSPPRTFDHKTSSCRYVIALTDHGMQTVIPILLQEVAKVAPNIELDFRTLREGDSLESMTHDLIHGDVDFIIGLKINTSPVVNCLDLFSDSFVTIVSSQHPRITERLTRKMYLKEKHILVSFSGDRNGLVDRILLNENQEREIAHTVDNFFSATLIVDKTDLLCTVSHKIANNLADNFNVKILKCPIKVPEFTVAMHWNKAYEGKPENAWFINFMADINKILKSSEQLG